LASFGWLGGVEEGADEDDDVMIIVGDDLDHA